jgi:hypothetical protein|tara:strand:+ start:412 stop:618 length:207 start_codon:yes stop_codon:yes gene_type:complete
MYKTKPSKPISKPLTPQHIFFEASSPLTQQQIDKLNFFIEELLFDDEDESNVPEFTTEFEQFDLTKTN